MVKRSASATRASNARRAHESASRERAQDVVDAKLKYQSDEGKLVAEDILAKGESFIKYHTKIAQDGVGARKTGFKLENGTDEVENYYLTQEQRVSHLDKSAGIQELLDYITRQSAPVSNTAAKKASGK